MILVYHGSYAEVRTPDIVHSRPNLDFGKGFYVTPVMEQAVNWAKRWKYRKQTPVLNTYCFRDELLADGTFNMKVFHRYDLEWLHFVVDNRLGTCSDDYDVVQGGIANDRVFNTLELFLEQLIPETEALRRLQFEKPNWQICIRKQELLERLLMFQEAKEVKDAGK